MKKTLLYFILPLLFTALCVNAQTTTWDFGNDTANWNSTTGFAAETVIQKLGVFPGSAITNMGQIALDATTPSAGWTTDGITYSQKFKLNGGSVPTGNLPSRRFVYFNVDGPCTVKMWFKTNTAGTQRNGIISDGGTQVASAVSVSDFGYVTLNYTTVGGGKLYAYSDASVNFYKIEVTGANVTTPALSTKNFQKELDITVYAKQNKIFLSNIKSSTQVNVYNVLGALVKTAQVDADSSLDINSGVYIVNAKSAEGEKSVKVIVQ